MHLSPTGAILLTEANRPFYSVLTVFQGSLEPIAVLIPVSTRVFTINTVYCPSLGAKCTRSYL